MAHLTPEEADRIVRAHIESAGPTDAALMSSWRGMVYAMLERLDLGEYRRDVIKLALQIVPLWSIAQPARVTPETHQFRSSDSRRWIAFFDSLHCAALMTLLSAPELPPRDEPERAQDVDLIDDIAKFARRHRDAVERAVRLGHGADVACSAFVLTTVADSCRSLMAIVLGRQLAQEFQEQYDACISAWTIIVPLIGEIPPA